jgi:hypothetical protein
MDLQGKFYQFDNAKMGGLSMIVKQGFAGTRKLLIAPRLVTKDEIANFIIKACERHYTPEDKHIHYAEAEYKLHDPSSDRVWIDWISSNEKLRKQHLGVGRDAICGVALQGAQSDCKILTGVPQISAWWFYERLGSEFNEHRSRFFLPIESLDTTKFNFDPLRAEWTTEILNGEGYSL